MVRPVYSVRLCANVRHIRRGFDNVCGPLSRFCADVGGNAWSSHPVRLCMRAYRGRRKRSSPRGLTESLLASYTAGERPYFGGLALVGGCGFRQAVANRTVNGDEWSMSCTVSVRRCGLDARFVPAARIAGSSFVRRCSLGSPPIHRRNAGSPPIHLGAKNSPGWTDREPCFRQRPEPEPGFPRTAGMRARYVDNGWDSNPELCRQGGFYGGTD